MLMKIIAYGLLLHPLSYLRSGWNILDGFIVLISIINLSISRKQAASLKFMKAFRAARALRPLRVVSRYPSLKIVVQSILAAIPNLFNVLLIAALFFLIFAILGVQFFKGTLQQCYSNVDYNLALPQYDYDDCLALNFLWKNANAGHFDNTLHAFLLLFEIASLEMWPEIMSNVMDGTKAYLKPKLNHNQLAAIYFVIFIIIGSFIVISMFVGVVVDEYNHKHETFTQAKTLTFYQLQYLKTYVEIINNPVDITLLPPHQVALSTSSFWA